MPDKSYYEIGSIEYAIAEYYDSEADNAEEILNAKLIAQDKDNLIAFIESAQSRGWFSGHIHD